MKSHLDAIAYVTPKEMVVRWFTIGNTTMTYVGREVAVDFEDICFSGRKFLIPRLKKGWSP